IDSSGDKLILHTPVFVTSIDGKLMDLFKRNMRQKVRIGLRPSDIVVKKVQESGFFPSNLYVVEPLGMIKILTLEKNNIKFQVKYIGSDTFEMGEKVYFGFPVEKLYYFDFDTGRNYLQE
ncbi:MAG: hypothetical protein NTX88_06555, partial [Candidatus Atribacteria bacterium]|nr:hypothetical protein [Candidatus Atribacteria bacterium]